VNGLGGSGHALALPTANSIMLPNEVFALACRAYYDEIGLIVDETNGEFAHSPYPEGMGETGYYLLHAHHQQQGILQSKDVGQCCFFSGYAKQWLLTCSYWPDNYFELWDIYEKYASLHAKECAKIVHKEKDEFGRSVHGVKSAERLHAERDENGKSIQGVKNNIRMNQELHKERDEFGKSVHALKIHNEKNEEGKSVVAVRAGRKAAEKLHKEKDEFGRSLHALKMHSEKDGFGRSVKAVKAAEKLNASMTPEEKREHGSKGGKNTNSQIWESTVDGFRSNPGAVAAHNRSRGWDPGARVRVK